MLVWTLVIAVTVIACAALFYAARAGAVNAAAGEPQDAERVHHRNMLAEIDRAEADGQLSPEDAVSARAELARDVLKHKQTEESATDSRGFSPLVAGATLVVIAGLGLGTYALIGAPTLPSSPLAEREDPDTIPAEVATAISKVEAQLMQTPDDVRGWQVLGPVYMRAGRYADAVNAYRRVLDLGGATPDSETDLAEALSMANGGIPSPEALTLFQSAADADPNHVRSRFYLAGDAMRKSDFPEAARLWAEVIALSDGTESWRPAADQALSVAEAAVSSAGDADAQSTMISGMVEGLAERLDSNGGTIAEWTQLIRAFIVLGQIDRAQQAYDDAKAAYPDVEERSQLDAFAQSNGLE